MRRWYSLRVTEPERAPCEFSFHPFDEREFRDRFFPALLGDEPIVRELLDAADASGPSWTALHKLFDDSRVAYVNAVEKRDGDAIRQTAFAAFAQFVAHLRPAYVGRGAGLSSIDRHAFPELAKYLRSPAALLARDGAPLEGVPADLGALVPATEPAGRSASVVVLADEVRPCVDALRAALPKLVPWLQERGLPAEELLAVALSALVEAKLQGRALIEARDVLVGDDHLPNGHRCSFEAPETLPPATVREIARTFGREPEPPPAAKPEPALAPAEPSSVRYTPQGQYEVGQRLEHKAFGEGEVVRILDSRRVRAVFGGEEKTLVQGLPPRD